MRTADAHAQIPRQNHNKIADGVCMAGVVRVGNVPAANLGLLPGRRVFPQTVRGGADHEVNKNNDDSTEPDCVACTPRRLGAG